MGYSISPYRSLMPKVDQGLVYIKNAAASTRAALFLCPPGCLRVHRWAGFNPRASPLVGDASPVEDSPGPKDTDLLNAAIKG